MESTVSKPRNWFEKVSASITRLYNTELLVGLIAVIVFLSWFFKIELFAFSVIIVYATVALVFVDDTAHLVAPLFLAPFVFSSGNADISQYFALAYLLGFVVAALIFHMIYYRKKFKIGKMFFPQIAISIALIIGGADNISKEGYMNGLAAVATLGLLILALYYLFFQYRNKESGLDFKRYLSKVLSWAGLIISFQVISYLIRMDHPFSELQNRFMELGWGIDNNAATMLLVTAPITMYLACRKDTMLPIAYVLSSALQYVCIVFTFSRGGMLAAIPTGLIALFLVIRKAPKRKQILFAIGIILVGAIAVLAVKFETVVRVLKTVTLQGTADSGRIKLYKEAWQCFVNHPFLGVGMGFIGENYDTYVTGQYYFHSTIFQIIASLGIVGFIAFVYFYFARYKIVFKNIRKSVFVMFTFTGMLGFEAYSMIDTGTFLPVPFMLLMMMLTMIIEEENQKETSNEEIAPFKKPEPECASHLGGSVLATYKPNINPEDNLINSNNDIVINNDIDSSSNISEDKELSSSEDTESSSPEDTEPPSSEHTESSSPEDTEPSSSEGTESSSPKNMEPSSPEDTEASPIEKNIVINETSTETNAETQLTVSGITKSKAKEQEAKTPSKNKPANTSVTKPKAKEQEAKTPSKNKPANTSVTKPKAKEQEAKTPSKNKPANTSVTKPKAKEQEAKAPSKNKPANTSVTKPKAKEQEAKAPSKNKPANTGTTKPKATGTAKKAKAKHVPIKK